MYRAPRWEFPWIGLERWWKSDASPRRSVIGREEWNKDWGRLRKRERVKGRCNGGIEFRRLSISSKEVGGGMNPRRGTSTGGRIPHPKYEGKSARSPPGPKHRKHRVKPKPRRAQRIQTTPRKRAARQRVYIPNRHRDSSHRALESVNGKERASIGPAFPKYVIRCEHGCKRDPNAYRGHKEHKAPGQKQDVGIAQKKFLLPYVTQNLRTGFTGNEILTHFDTRGESAGWVQIEMNFKKKATCRDARRRRLYGGTGPVSGTPARAVLASASKNKRAVTGGNVAVHTRPLTAADGRRRVN
ncbi:hypothetical protein C8R44DRAFT_731996 [Mycena epipterygia]|nr:hypothetical protein C8R44DRAFT_731996 [Mycena epipterygia]